MKEIIYQIDGMKCSMCEAHVNDAVRKVVNVKKIKSSHKKNNTIIICEDNVDEAIIEEAINNQGYKIISKDSHNYVKKGLFK